MFFVCFLESIYVFCVICPWGNICVSLVFFWRGYVLFSGINSYALYGSFLENITFLTAGFWNIFLCFVCISQYIYGLCNVFWEEVSFLWYKYCVFCVGFGLRWPRIVPVIGPIRLISFLRTTWTTCHLSISCFPPLPPPRVNPYPVFPLTTSAC